MHFLQLINNTFTLVLLIVFVAAFVGLALYYGLFFLRVALWKSKKQEGGRHMDDRSLPSVSVVMVAHNEGSYLRDNLVYLLEQDYPNYEVIVVDYLSTDDTKFVLQVCGDNYPNLKTIPFKEDINFFSGKKYPLSIGIRSAANDIILLTEPDSVPKGFDWIRGMMEGYAHNADIVIGYSGLRQDKGMLNAMMQYDNLTWTSHSFGCAIMGNPYTANGRNLSYKRQFFFDRGAFTRHYAEPEGADDLFVNQNANRRNTEVVLDERSFVQTNPRSSFAAWHKLRKMRYASKRFYGVKDMMMLALNPLLVLLFYAAGILLCCKGWLPAIIFASALVLIWAWHIVSFSRICKRFDIKKVFWFAPLMEIYFFFANTFLLTLALLRRK